jgi:hypothetical protein
MKLQDPGNLYQSGANLNDLKSAGLKGNGRNQFRDDGSRDEIHQVQTCNYQVDAHELELHLVTY